MRKRAELVDETRQRIVEATVQLHETQGLTATTVSGIAETAGVTRLTVYRHFPDDEALFAACSAHWMAQQQPPDPDAWLAIADPEARLRAGLADLYRFYRQGEQMLTNVHRDHTALPESMQHEEEAERRRHRDILLDPFTAEGAQRRRVRSLIGHAVSFWTWRSLCVDEGMSNRGAVDAMACLVLGCAER